MPSIDVEKLRALRERRLLTQAELAGKAGVRPATITDIETGKHKPRGSTVRKIAKALSVRPTELL
jgi:transcriptional regulator with XRE-family HTH domain